MGLTYAQAHDLPVGELMDLITIDHIKHGAATLRSDDDEEIIPDLR